MHEEEVAGRSVGLTFDPLSRQHALVEIVYRSKDFHSRHYFAVSAMLQCGNYGHHCRDYVLAPPPLPVADDAPPVHVGGALYWMSDPRLGRSRERAVVSFDVATRTFDVVPCPACIAAWSGTSPCRASVAELGGALHAVLADPAANSLDVWRLERGGSGWGRACVIRLDGAPPGYDLGTNDVVPLAVHPDDGRVLLSAGRRIGLYDPAEQTVQDLRSLEGMEDGAAALAPMVYEESLACYPCRLARARRLSQS
ncbi:hypothetical protein VPH35_004549 [Triticum aestivum]|uniref:uncharacterized protein n=1 Tax=Triticum aestivum TaxID=4565 RepID=UPI00084269D8|nr:uncharacterized protein LOC123180730 [Triticum aestivum]